MGCDIHMCLERRRRNTENGGDEKIPINLDTQWQTVFINRWSAFNPGRIYGMFAKLANVRNYWEDILIPIEQRGFPDDASPATIANYADRIIPDEEWRDYMREWDHAPITQTDADKTLEKYEKYGVRIIETGNNRYITNPDFHSANWCTSDELEACVNEVFKERDIWGDKADYMAVVGLMKGIESDGIWETRAVFWFDN